MMDAKNKPKLYPELNNLSQAWDVMEPEALNEAESQWIESGDRFARPIPILQQMHFKEFQHFSEQQMDQELMHDFPILIAGKRTDTEATRE